MSLSPSNLISTASAEISKCINRIKKKKPPEVPPRILVLPPVTPISTPRKFQSTKKKRKQILTLSQLWQDEEFLKLFFAQFHGSEKLVLPLVSKRWRDISYATPAFWQDLIPVLKCKELKASGGVPLDAALRRRFYAGIVKRGFTSLKLLNADDGDADDVLIHFSQGSQLIKQLHIHSSSISDKGFYNILDHLMNIEDLELVSCNEISEDGVRCLSRCVKLKKLALYDCIHIADQSVEFIATHLELTSFELQAYHVTDACLSSFSKNFNLTVLKLNSCWELSNQAVLYIVSALPQLKTLSLSGCSKITDEGIEILAENLPNLKSFDLSWCPRITDASLECIACDLVQLEVLILDRCTPITDLGIGYLSTMQSLQFLSLRWLQIRDASVHALTSLRKLKFLSLAGCVNVNPNSLCELTSLKSLEELELTNCGVTRKVVQHLKSNSRFIVVQ